jgi:Fur family zinc uptake transcriptional regulator
MAVYKPQFYSARHDHLLCITKAITRADNLCKSRGARFTRLRRRVLEIVWQSHRPLGAYEILRTLGAEGESTAPPTVYRALDFLAEQGLTHRISSLNAFVGCASPGHAGAVQFLICRACGTAAELNDQKVENAIARSAASIGFRAVNHVVEIAGLCPNCD